MGPMNMNIMKYVALSTFGILVSSFIYKTLCNLCRTQSNNNHRHRHRQNKMLLANFVLALLVNLFGIIMALGLESSVFFKMLILVSHLTSLQLWCLWTLSRFFSLMQIGTGCFKRDIYKILVYVTWCLSVVMVTSIFMMATIEPERSVYLIWSVVSFRLSVILVSVPVCVASLIKGKDLKQDLVRRTFIIGRKRRALDAYAELRPSISFALYFCFWTCGLWFLASLCDVLLVVSDSMDFLDGLEVMFGTLYVVVNPLVIGQLRTIVFNILLRRNSIAAAVVLRNNRYCNCHLVPSPSAIVATSPKPKLKPREATLSPFRSLEIRTLSQCPALDLNDVSIETTHC